MLTNHPERKHWNEYLSGIRYISRLYNFPYSDLKEIDHNIKHELLRFRGVPVGVKVETEIRGYWIAISSQLISNIFYSIIMRIIAIMDRFEHLALSSGPLI